MIESDRDPHIERFAHIARRPVQLADGARLRLMAAVHAAPAPERRNAILAQILSPRALANSPVIGGLLAAGLVGIGIFIGLTRFGHPLTEQPATVAAAPTVHDTVLTVMQFVITAPPTATHVALVGDFNGWSTAATPMTRSSASKWTVSLPLEPGRHTYAFVVDGSKWMADPAALQAPDDGFGLRSSIVLVHRGTAM